MDQSLVSSIALIYKIYILALTENILFVTVVSLIFQIHGLFPQCDIEKAYCGSKKDTSLYVHIVDVIRVVNFV